MSCTLAATVCASDVIAAYEVILAAHEKPELVLAAHGHSIIARADLVEAHLTIARALREIDAAIRANPKREMWSHEARDLSRALTNSDRVDRLEIAHVHEQAARLLSGDYAS
jgi:hypothetical protein